MDKSKALKWLKTRLDTTFFLNFFIMNCAFKHNFSKKS